MTFSFARAPQDEAMKLWGEQASHIPAAQNAFLHRLRLNSAARSGQYRAALEDAA